MPNIASILKEEIVRLARKELRAETEKLKKAGAQHRSEIAALKRRVLELEKQSSRMARTVKGKGSSESVHEPDSKTRFSAKGLAAHRERLGLSAGDMGRLLGVSAQTVYNWEGGKSRPRPMQLSALALVRGMGKREALAKLADPAQ
jgi:DNA-binding transcriptional regulator YiaG